MKSSEKSGVRNLVSKAPEELPPPPLKPKKDWLTQRVERMLTDWANLPTALAVGDKQIQRICRRYPEVFSVLGRGQNLLAVIARIASDLRRAWDAPDLRHRDWYVHQLRVFYWHSILRAQQGKKFDEKKLAPWLDSPPPMPTPFEDATFHFQISLADKAVHCWNPTCPAPYFIAAKKGQKYCSDNCAVPAQREAKRKWWNQNRAKNGGAQ